MILNGVLYIRLTRPSALLLQEALRARVATVAPAVTKRLQASLNVERDEYARVPHQPEILNVVMAALGDAARRISQPNRFGFFATHERFQDFTRATMRASKGEQDVIDLERMVDPRARGDVIDFAAVEKRLKRVQLKSAAWGKRRRPTLFPRPRLNRFLRSTYMRDVRVSADEADRMTPEAVNGFIGLYKDNIDIISAFACMDDKRRGSFLTFASSMNYIFGMGQLNEAMRYIQGTIFNGDDELTAQALMGHEIYSQDLMKWMFGQRISGCNLVRMHGDGVIAGIGSAGKDLVRAAHEKDLSMARDIVTHLEEGVNVEEGDVVAEHARLTLLTRAIGVSRGIVGEHMKPTWLARHQDRVSDDIKLLEKDLKCRAAISASGRGP